MFEVAKKAACDINVDPRLMFRITPKLDGLAGRLDDKTQTLISRGDGYAGNDLSHLIENGLSVIGDISKGRVGEIVISKDYFDRVLAKEYSDPRTFVSGMANSDSLNEGAKAALKEKAVHLALFSSLEGMEVSGALLIVDIDRLSTQVKATCSYMMDGIVIEVIDEAVKAHMGHSSHHHHWQLAKKELGETAEAKVIGVDWQVGRTGKITPVILIEPTKLCNAIIKKVTGHHAQYMTNHGIGIEAIILITRSGEVIPKHLRTVKTAEVTLPEMCPCCKSLTGLRSAFMHCLGDNCSAQTVTGLIHHFKTIQTDLFGSKTVERLVAAGHDTIDKVYELSIQDIIDAGMGSGQAANLIAEMQRSISEPLRDNLLLASIGISNLGRGASKKLLAHYRIDNLAGVTATDIANIEGFGSVTSASISETLASKSDLLLFLINQGFNILHTSDAKEVTSEGALSGVNLVFTGKMSGSRDEMKAHAAELGGTAQSSVNKKTNILVCGEKVGQKKLDAATAKGVEIIDEKTYWDRYAVVKEAA